MKNRHFLLITFLISLSPTLFAQKNFLDVNYIEVTGTSEMDIEPDMIYLQIIINEKDFKKSVSIDQQEEAMINALTKLGINTKKDLTMEDLDSDFKKKRFSLSDILLSKHYILLVHDGPTASKVYSSLEDIGISNISISKIDHSKIQDLRKMVRANAMKAAKEKAEYLTAAVGQTIGNALYIEEQNQFRGNYLSNQYTPMKTSEKYESEIEFKPISIKFSMLVRFELK